MNYRCVRCAPMPAGFQFEADKDQCLKCGAAGPIAGVYELTAVHFAAVDPDGPVQGMGEARLRIACQPKRAVMSAHMLDNFHASGDPRAVTCKSCISTPIYKQQSAWIGEVEKAMRGGLAIDGGCCN